MVFYLFFCSMYIKKCVPGGYAMLAYVDSTFALLDIAVLIQIWSKWDGIAICFTHVSVMLRAISSEFKTIFIDKV